MVAPWRLAPGLKLPVGSIDRSVTIVSTRVLSCRVASHPTGRADRYNRSLVVGWRGAIALTIRILGFAQITVSIVPIYCVAWLPDLLDSQLLGGAVVKSMGQRCAGR